MRSSSTQRGDNPEPATFETDSKALHESPAASPATTRGADEFDSDTVDAGGIDQGGWAQAGWQRQNVQERSVMRRSAGSGFEVVLAEPEILTDTENQPRISTTFVCREQPSVSHPQGLRDLVEFASLGIELSLLPGADLLDAMNADTPGHRAAAVAAVAFNLRYGSSELLASTGSVQSPGTVAMSLTLARDPALALLDAMAGYDAPLQLQSTVQWRPPAATAMRYWLTDLAAVAQFLHSRADDRGVFYQVDIEAYLPIMLESGIVTSTDTSANPQAEALSVDAFVSAVPLLLKRLPDDERIATLGAAYQLQPWSGGSMGIRITSCVAAAPPALSLESSLRSVLSATAADILDPSLTHFVAHNGRGRLVALNKRAGVPLDISTRALPDSTVRLVAQGGQLKSVSASVRPATSVLGNPALAHLMQPAVSFRPDMQIALNNSKRFLPVISAKAKPPWPDRRNSKRRWYLPEFRLPEAGAGQQHPGFMFRFRREGHDSEGRPGLAGTVIYRLQQSAPEETQRAINKLDSDIKVSAVPVQALSATLDIPFRDQRGVTRLESFTAQSLKLKADTLELEFAFADNWARIAYGALAYAAYQTRAPLLRIEYHYEAYVKKNRFNKLQLAAGAKQIGLTAAALSLRKTSARAGSARDGKHATMLSLQDGSRLTLGNKAGTGQRPAAGMLSLGTLRPHAFRPAAIAQIKPQLQIQAQLNNALSQVKYVLSKRQHTQVLDALIPCASYGGSFMEQVEGQAQALAIGCQEAYQLGVTPHRIYEEVSLPAPLAAICRVLRVLSTPNRFVIVPAAYTITRFGVDEEGRASQPCVLLFSTVDIDELENSRCVIACSLAEDLGAVDYSRVLDHLRRQVNPRAVLDTVLSRAPQARINWSLPTDADGLLRLSIEAINTTSGFEVSITTDAIGLPQIAQIMRHIGITAAVSFTLSDGLGVESLLRLDLGRITGPAPAGPVTVEQQGANLKLTNTLSVPVQLGSLLKIDEQGMITAELEAQRELGAGGSTVISGQSGEWLVETHAVANAQIPEIRSFAEDITVSVLLHDQLRDDDGGIDEFALSASVVAADNSETTVRFDGTEELVEQTFLLPLTTFLAKPSLQLSVSVKRGGQRTEHGPVSWNLARDGYLLTLTKALFNLV